VLIVIDQLPTWTFERDRPHFTGGLARLLREGVYASASIPYAMPFTAPGHASIATGAAPRVHGVPGNAWYRRAEGRVRSAEFDPAAYVFRVGPSHRGELTVDDGASGRALRVDGIADQLRRSSPKARAIAIGLKARAVSFIAGRRPELAVWYEPAAGGMTTSRAYASELPRWLAELARDKPASRFFRQVWQPRDPALLARVPGIADDSAGEGGAFGLDTSFPHDLAATDAPAQAFAHTPFGDEVVLDVAFAALDALELGADDAPDLLALAFNAHDYAAHLWGAESWEVLDLTLRLDAALGQLFDELDRRLGPTGWAAILASDHGGTPVVDRRPGRRITSAEIRHVVETSLERRLGPGPWVAAIVSGNIYLAPRFAAVADREVALDEAAAALSAIPQIAAAGRTDRVCAGSTSLERALCLSMVEGESGELYLVPVAGSLISDYRTGTHHDAPFADNRRVPVVVRAPSRMVAPGAASLLQIAPTLAVLLGVPPPPSASAPPLFGVR
jgi:hypothetical protein